MRYDESNEMFRLAVELVNQTSRNIFLTGKAGTGKTTFLKYIRDNCPKQMAIVAPTGVAAINAGGVTIHSFFQLPFSPFVPGPAGFSANQETINPNSLISRLRLTSEKRKILQQLELLVIDEISMVRCDILDAIDTVLRHVRKRPHEKFGGVQLLFIGDMFQLPPVAKEAEWRILSGYYEAPYFFESAALKDEPPVYIEFNKIYRQSDETFIRVLNQVRNNELDKQSFGILESRFQPSFHRESGDGYIILTTHNETVRTINSKELARLDSQTFTYEAEIEGDFLETAYPGEETLRLKVGAQVMFIRNDLDKNKRYFNGKIGVVVKLEKEKIIVKCPADADEIEVSKIKWENIRYTLNKRSRAVEEEVLGAFTQYPLRLAWAITIHKSQGLTFEKAVIDAGNAFDSGQVYVALSRCTSLEGMVLQSRIRSNSLSIDNRIVRFCQSGSDGMVQDEMISAKKGHQEKLLLSLFDFRVALDNTRELMKSLTDHRASFNPASLTWLEELLGKITAVQETADKFQIWLQARFRDPVLPGENAILKERAAKASQHFTKELTTIIEYLLQSPVVTDSRLHSRDYNEDLKELFAELSAKKFMLSGFDSDFDAEVLYRRKKEFVLPAFRIDSYGGVVEESQESPHPILRKQLRKLRDAICAPLGIPIYMVATGKSLDELARYLPHTLAEIGKITGFGNTKVQRYGQDFLDIILEYCNEKGLSSLMHERTEGRKSRRERKGKTDTKAESLRLYREGMTVSEIARDRKLTPQTIQDHLAHYIALGEININELLSADKLSVIEPVIRDFEGGALAPLKSRLGNDISFGEIRLALAWKAFRDAIATGEQ
ncbi:MAG TPA: helix-turn-helix domain-containing protein [Chitinophagaceae bacterium]|nr:helix-turn-helix domain-containing protein [Chitinophagaceae bacterium]